VAPRWFRQLQAAIPGKGLRQQEDGAIPPWFAGDFVRCYRLRERLIDHAQQLYHRCSQTALSVCVSALSHLAGDVIRWSVAAPLGIGVAHPFLDRRVLCLGLGIRSRLRPQPGKLKPVLAEAMRDKLPAVILERRRKGHFNEIYYLGLARNLPALEAMIREAPPVALEFFDKPVLLQALQEAGMAGTEPRRLQRLNFTLALIKWLSMQAEWRRSRESPTALFRMEIVRQ
jgi:asparagine synthase (glutamine-hydrolysing)